MHLGYFHKIREVRKIKLKMILTKFILLFSFISLIYARNGNELIDIVFSGNYEFVDLSYPFDNNTVYWPDYLRFGFTKESVIVTDDFWLAANEFEASEHGGTHFDAPQHFSENGWKVGDVPFDRLIVSLVVIDVSSLVNGDPNFVLDKSHLSEPLIPYNEPCVIIFKFGWSVYYSNATQFLGYDEERDTLSFPGLSPEIAEWIVASYKNVVGVGVDVASVDPGSSTEYRVHTILLNANLYQLESVNLEATLPEFGCLGIVLPMKIRHGTGAPLRLAAICPKADA